MLSCAQLGARYRLALNSQKIYEMPRCVLPEGARLTVSWSCSAIFSMRSCFALQSSERIAMMQPLRSASEPLPRSSRKLMLP